MGETVGSETPDDTARAIETVGVAGASCGETADGGQRRLWLRYCMYTCMYVVITGPRRKILPHKVSTGEACEMHHACMLHLWHAGPYFFSFALF